MRIAICYFGLLRTFRKTFPAHKQHIYDVLKENNIDYDIYIHTWSGSYTNKRGNSTEIYNHNTDISDIVVPFKQRTDDQDQFISNLNMDDYFYRDVYEKLGNCKEGEWLPDMLLYQMCSQESQKRLINMVFESGIEYDRIIILRPDLEMPIPLRIEPIVSMKVNHIILPQDEHCGGYNDRFAIVNPKMVLYYSHRIDEAKEFRKHHGRIAGETYLKYILDKYKFIIKVENIPSTICRR